MVDDCGFRSWEASREVWSIQYPYRQNWISPSGRLRSAYDHIGRYKSGILELAYAGRHIPMDGFRAPQSPAVRFQRQSSDETFRLLRPGMVVYEVLSRCVPFYQDADLVVVVHVAEGKRPERPRGAEGAWFTDDVWMILERCWTRKPWSRPSIKDVLQCLEKASRSWIPPPPWMVTGAPTTDLSSRNSSDSSIEGSTTSSSESSECSSTSSASNEEIFQVFVKVAGKKLRRTKAGGIKKKTKSKEKHFCPHCNKSFIRDHDAERHQRTCSSKWCSVCTKPLPVRLDARRRHWGTLECLDAARKRGYARVRNLRASLKGVRMLLLFLFLFMFYCLMYDIVVR